MILPATYVSALILMVLATLCAGSWANAQKLAGKWRFELFYYDLSFGVLLCAAIAAFTLGQFASKELSFSDNFLIASKRQMAWGVAAGFVFNLGNILLAGAISVSGLSIAFPISLGLALIVQSVWNYVANPQAFSAILLFLGLVMVLAAVIMDAFTFSAYLDGRRQAAIKAASLHPDPRTAKSAMAAGPGAGRGIVLSVIGGIVMGFSYPLLTFCREGDSGVAPYGLGLLFAAGILGSSLFYVPFFLNFPVDGPPIELADYFKGTSRQHLVGLAAGIVLMAGFLCSFTAMAAPKIANAFFGYDGFTEAAAIVAAFWGLAVWKDFRAAGFGVKMLLTGTIVLFAVGLGIVSVSLHAG